MKTPAILAFLLLSSPAFAQIEKETMASDEEMTQVNVSLENIGCKAVEVEKEADNLFEVDDAECTVGQYDIKLDGEFNIISMTKDF
jgi:hypothetical protein